MENNRFIYDDLRRYFGGVDRKNPAWPIQKLINLIPAYSRLWLDRGGLGPSAAWVMTMASRGFAQNMANSLRIYAKSTYGQMLAVELSTLNTYFDEHTLNLNPEMIIASGWKLKVDFVLCDYKDMDSFWCIVSFEKGEVEYSKTLSYELDEDQDLFEFFEEDFCKFILPVLRTGRPDFEDYWDED